jgi:hypothetical protein
LLVLQRVHLGFEPLQVLLDVHQSLLTLILHLKEKKKWTGLRDPILRL